MKTLRMEQGSSLLEFSLITPIVALLFMGIVDLGLMIQRAMLVAEASHVGAEYGTLLGHATDTSGMQNAAFVSIGTSNLGGAAASVNATSWCACTSGGAAVSCTTVCPTYPTPLQYVQVKTVATIPVLYGYPGLPASLTVQAQSILRAP